MIDDTSKDIQGDGEWGEVLDWTIIPIHSIVLPDGKLLSFGTDQNANQVGQFVYSLWDPETNETKILPNTTGVNIFCSNMAIDPVTGNVIIMGGDQYQYLDGPQYGGITDAVVFDYKTETIRDATDEDGNLTDLAYGRWYGSVITLSNGEILMAGGRGDDYTGSTIPEIYNAQTGFRSLTGAEIVDIRDNDTGVGPYWYPHLWQASDGDVWFVEANGGSGGRGDMYRMDVTGLGSVEKVGQVPFDSRESASSIMYQTDKVLIMANNGWVWSGDLSTEVPSWERAFYVPDSNDASQSSSRSQGMFVLLPDGRVSIVGGTDPNGDDAYKLENAQLTVVTWDPKNPTAPLEVSAEQSLARLYHSSAQLLPDGTIWSGGGGAPGPLENKNAEVLTPSYLYDENGDLADRPQIVDAPTNIDAGTTFLMTVDEASAISMVSVVKSGAATHARNSDARFLELDYTIIDENTIEVTAPASNEIIPGLYMLYTVSTDGVPSEASMLGVNMATLVDTGSVGNDVTTVYNIDDEQIDGAFALSAEVRFDDVDGSANQIIFDFGNTAGADSISLSQIGTTNDLEFSVTVDGQTFSIIAQNAIVEGESAIYRVGIDPDGIMRIAKNGDLLVESETADPSRVPADVDRLNYLVGESTEAGSSELIGLIRNLKIANYGEIDELDGANALSPCAVTGEAACLCSKLVPGVDDTEGNDAPKIFADYSVIAGMVSEVPHNVQGENTALLATNGVVAFADADTTDTHTASFVPKDGGVGYLGTFALGLPTTTEWAITGSVAWTFKVPDSALVNLNTGESITQSYDITVDDGNGGTATQTVSVTINGADDTTPANVIVGTNNRDLIDGTVGDDDIDAKGGYDTIFESGGNDLIDGGDTGYNQVDYLGRPADYTFSKNIDGSISVVKPDGGVDTLKNIGGIWFNGASKWYDIDALVTNSAPVVNAAGSTLAGAVSELADGVADENIANLTATGTIAYQDADGDKIKTALVAENGNGYLGVLSTNIAANGAVTWNYVVNDAALESLEAGDSLTQSYTITLDDENGGKVNEIVTLTINGAADTPNAVPVIDATSEVAGTVSELADGAVGENTTDLKASGSIAFSDLDTADVHTASVTANGENYLGSIALGPIVDGAFTWEFTVADKDLNGLTAADTREQNYTITVDDGRGGKATQLVTVTITGADDAPNNLPIIDAASVVDGTINELADGATGENTATLNASGSLLVSDADGDTLTASAVPKAANYLGSFTLGTVVHGAITWDFNVSDGALDSLTAGQTLVQSYDITVDDGNGGAATQTVSVTINGADDTTPANVIVGTNNRDLIDGTVGDDDVDAKGGYDTIFESGGNDLIDGGDTGYNQVDYLGRPADYTFSKNIDGSISVVKPDGGVDTLTNIGGIWFNGASKWYDIDALVTNSAPVVNAAGSTLAGAVTELADGAAGENIADLTASGTIAYQDADGDKIKTALVAENGSGYLGVLSTNIAANGVVTWNYVVNDAALESLEAGDSLTQSYTITLDDGNGGKVNEIVTLTINGAADTPNAVPVIDATSEVVGAVSELADGAAGENTTDLKTSGSIAFSDLDAADVHTASVTANGENYLGSIALGPIVDGAFTWEFSVADKDLNGLNAADTREQNYTITVDDGRGGKATQLVTVTITGADDAPNNLPMIDAASIVDGTINELVDGATGENTATLSATGSLLVSDADGDTLTASALPKAANYLGSFKLGAVVDGEITWDFSVSDGALDSLTAGQTLVQSYDITVDDGNGGTATQTVSVTINGADDTNPANVVVGTSGNDLIDGTSGDDDINGLGGRDTISETGGSDLIDGGDTGYNQVDYQGKSSDYTFTVKTDGAIQVEKPSGDIDILKNIGGIWFNGESKWFDIEDLVGALPPTGGTREINGTAGNDVLAGTSDNDIINLMGGRDVVSGSAGDDIINGGSGYNQVDYAGSAADYIFTGNSNGSVSVQKPNGTDTLTDIGGIWFNGQGAWFDIDDLLVDAPAITEDAGALV